MRQIQIQNHGDKHTIWLSEAYVLSNTGVSRAYLRVSKHRYKSASNKEGKSWRWLTYQGVVYYAYDGIANDKPSCYRDRLPSEEELLSMARKTPSDDPAFIERNRGMLIAEMEKRRCKSDQDWYQFEGGQTIAQSIDLSKSVAWLRSLRHQISQCAWIRYGYETKKEWMALVLTVLGEQSLYGLKVKTQRHLHRKLSDFPSDAEPNLQVRYLLHKGIGNENRKIVGRYPYVVSDTGEVVELDIHQGIMFSLVMNLNQERASLYEKYRSMVEGMGIAAVSLRTFERSTNKYNYKALISLGRDGYKSFNDQYLPYVSAHKLQYANSMWAIDGSGTKLAYQERGKQASLYMVRVYDVASSALVGYAVGAKEDSSLVKASLKMAIEMSGGYIPREIITDNGSSFTSNEGKSLLSELCDKHRTIAPGNSQENPAEVFIRLTTAMCREYSNWMYAGFVAHFGKSKNKTNPDKWEVSKLPTKEEAYLQAEELASKWNGMMTENGETRWNRYQVRNMDCRRLDVKAWRKCFAHKTEVDLSYMRGFINVRIKGKRLQFTIDKYEEKLEMLAGATGYKDKMMVSVCFTEQCCDVYNLEGKYLMSCHPTQKAHKSYAEGNAETHKNLVHLRTRKEKFVTKALNLAEETQKIATDVGLKSGDPMPYGLKAKANFRIKDEYNEEMEVLIEKEQKNKAMSVEQRAIKDL